MDVLGYLRLVRRHWWIVLVTVMLGLGTAALVTVRTAPRYEASVTFFVTTPSQGVTDAYQGSLFLQQRVKSYGDLLTSDRRAQRTREGRLSERDRAWSADKQRGWRRKGARWQPPAGGGKIAMA